MIIKIKYGFVFEGLVYGWRKDWRLYRLPQNIGKRFYPMKELKLSRGRYSVNRKRKSIAQLKEITTFINYEYQEIKDSDLPF